MPRPLRLALCWLLLGIALAQLAWEVPKMDGWRDHGLFYYAPRLFRTGRNAYDWEAMKATWRADGMPLGVDPATTMSGFVNPPGMAALTLPPSLMPPRLAYRSEDAWNLLALAVCLLLLLSMTRSAPLQRGNSKREQDANGDESANQGRDETREEGANPDEGAVREEGAINRALPGEDSVPRAVGSGWTLEARILFAAYVIWLPPLHSVLWLGQSTILICACLAGAFVLLGRGRPLAGGALIGLALAKFTLSLPFFALLVYRRQWRAAGAALVTFFALNLVMALPFGVANTVREYRAVVARENRPGTSYDPLTTDPRWMPNTLVQAKRLFVLVLGENRRVVDTANTLFSLATIAALAFVLRPKGKRAGSGFAPLEIALLSLASLILFYHRVYDMGILILALCGLLDYGFRQPWRRTPMWTLAVALTLFVSYLIPSSFLSLNIWLEEPTKCFVTCLLLIVLFVCLLRLAHENNRFNSARG